jgi:hypothetical protein
LVQLPGWCLQNGYHSHHNDSNAVQLQLTRSGPPEANFRDARETRRLTSYPNRIANRLLYIISVYRFWKSHALLA